MNRRAFFVGLASATLATSSKAHMQSQPTDENAAWLRLDDLFATMFERARRHADRNDRRRVLEFVRGIRPPLVEMKGAKLEIAGSLRLANCSANRAPAQARGAASRLLGLLNELTTQIRTLSAAVQPIGMATNMTQLASQLQELRTGRKMWVEDVDEFCTRSEPERRVFLSEIGIGINTLERCLRRLDTLTERLSG